MGSTRECVIDEGLFVHSATDEVNPRLNFWVLVLFLMKMMVLKEGLRPPTPAVIIGQDQSQEFSVES